QAGDKAGAFAFRQGQSLIKVGAYQLPPIDPRPRHSSPVLSRTLKIGANAAVQIDARFLPLALHRAFRDAAHRPDFSEREAAEKFQVYDRRQLAIELGQFVQRVADAAKLALVSQVGRGLRAGQRSDLELPAALDGAAVARVVDDQPAHGARRISHEARAVRK